MANDRKESSKYFATGALFALCCLFGCRRASQPEEPILLPVDLNSTAITLQRVPGDISGPSYTLTIRGDGRVEYEGRNGVPAIGHRTSAVSPESVLALFKELDQMKFMSAKERDLTFGAGDVITIIITVYVDGKTAQMKSEGFDNWSYPSQETLKKMKPVQLSDVHFQQLFRHIISAAEADRWVKCSPGCMSYLRYLYKPSLITGIEFVDPRGHSDLAQAMIEAGADVNVANAKGTTPLMAAAKKGDSDVVCDLLEHGAKRQAKDKKGRTALDIARDPAIRKMLTSDSEKCSESEASAAQ